MPARKKRMEVKVMSLGMLVSLTSIFAMMAAEGKLGALVEILNAVARIGQ